MEKSKTEKEHYLSLLLRYHRRVRGRTEHTPKTCFKETLHQELRVKMVTLGETLIIFEKMLPF